MSISINVTPAASGGTFTVGSVSSQNLTLEVTGGIGPPGTDVALAAGTGISISQVNNTATISSTLVIPDNLADLSDVTLGNVTTGQVLAYNGTAWTAAADNALTLSTSAASDLGTAAIGTSGEAARADHVHNLPTFAEITTGTATVTGDLTLDPSTGGVIVAGGTAGSGSFTLNCEANTHGVTIQGPPHSAAATYTLTLPTSSGAANQVLQTDGSGGLSWADQTAGGGITWATEPAASNSSGTAGQIAYGSGFFYLHDGTEWRRAALSTFGTVAPTITITQQPQSLTLADGGSGNLTVAATVSDSSSPTYQWQSYNGSAYSDIANATAATYSLSGVSAADNGTQYRAIVSAPGAAAVTSSVATLTVTAAAETFDLLTEASDRLMTETGDSLDHDGVITLTITQQPQNTAAADGEASFTVAATVNDGSTLAYQWEQSDDAGVTWSSLTGETSATLNLTGLTSDDDGERYRVVVDSPSVEPVTSDVATLSVPVPLVISNITDANLIGANGDYELSFSAPTVNGKNYYRKGSGTNSGYPEYVVYFEGSKWIIARQDQTSGTEPDYDPTYYFFSDNNIQPSDPVTPPTTGWTGYLLTGSVTVTVNT